MNNGRDCPHGRQVGKCDTCDLIEAEKEIEALKAQVEQLREDSLVAFGDGFYDGYLRYAKLCGDLEFTDDVMRQSELAEAGSIFGKMVGSSVRVAEIKAQAGRDGFVAGANDAAAYIAQQINAGSSSIDLDTSLAADKYANKIRQQGEQK